jgi:hypothetical protein
VFAAPSPERAVEPSDESASSRFGQGSSGGRGNDIRTSVIGPMNGGFETKPTAVPHAPRRNWSPSDRPYAWLNEAASAIVQPEFAGRPSVGRPTRADRGEPKGFTAVLGPKGRTKQAFRAAPRPGRGAPEASFGLRQPERRSMYRYILCPQRLSTQNLVSFDMKITSPDRSKGTPNWPFKATEGCLCGEVVTTVLLSSRPNA